MIRMIAWTMITRRRSHDAGMFVAVNFQLWVKSFQASGSRAKISKSLYDLYTYVTASLNKCMEVLYILVQYMIVIL
jgi:hypothetical protein